MASRLCHVLQHWRAARPGGMDAGDKFSCPAGHLQERPAQAKWAGGPPVVPALPLGAEIMGGVQGKEQAWPCGEAGLGI